MPKTRTLNQELAAVTATILGCRQCHTRKAKGEFLLDRFEGDMVVRQWFTIALSADWMLPPPEALKLLYWFEPDTELVPLRKLLKQIVEVKKLGRQLAGHCLTLLNIQVDTLQLIFERDLQCGVDGALLNKVRARLELEPITPVAVPPKLADFQLVVSTDGQFGHNGTIVAGNEKVGTVIFEQNNSVPAYVQACRNAGMATEIPSYAKDL